MPGFRLPRNSPFQFSDAVNLDALDYAYQQSRVTIPTTSKESTELGKKWGFTFFDIDSLLAVQRPDRIYPPYKNLSEAIQAAVWARVDKLAFKYGEIRVTEARNELDRRVVNRINSLLENLNRRLGNGNWRESSQRILRQGAATAGALGAAGAAAGPWGAVIGAGLGAIIGTVTGVIDFKQKEKIIEEWRLIISEFTELERYQCLSYGRQIFLETVKLEGYRYEGDTTQPYSDEWIDGTQPQPFGHSIVTAGPIGVWTLCKQVNLEYPTSPEPLPVPLSESHVEKMINAFEDTNERNRRGAAWESMLKSGNATIPDPIHFWYIAAHLCSDHPPDFYCRDMTHRRHVCEDPRKGTPWIREKMWGWIKDMRVREVRATARAFGLTGISPGVFTPDIDRKIVDEMAQYVG